MSSVAIVNTFKANRAHVMGGGIWLDSSNLALNGSNHFKGCVASFEGGAVYSYAATASLPGNSTFESNTATTGGGIHARWGNVRVTNCSDFRHNIAVFGGGIYTDNIAPLNLLTLARSVVIGQAILVVVYMLQEVFLDFLAPA